jgi:poly(3-hydroxybutyrate) depolymerase
MTNKDRAARAWSQRAVLLPTYLTLLASACSDNASNPGYTDSGASNSSASTITSGGSGTAMTGVTSNDATSSSTGVNGQATTGFGTLGGSTTSATTSGTTTSSAASTGGTSSTGATTGQATTGGGGATGSTTSGATTGGSSGPVPSSGCGETSTLEFGPVPGESGQSVGFGDGGYVTIQSSGETRGFAVRLPDNYDKDKPYWLVFGFHWNGGNSKEVDTGGSNGYEMAHFGLQQLSNNGAIFVAPDGLNAGWANSGGRDLQFVDDMVQLIKENYCVDETHLFANGFSYGGGMSYEIACARANDFRGVAIYEGAELSGCDGGNDPIAFWQMVGLEDTVTGMNLATPLRDRFVENNGCTPQNPPQPPEAPPYLNPGGHICTDYDGCSTGHPLRWCVHQSGHGNAIVDGKGDLYNTCATPPNSCSDTCPCSWVPEDVWSFFTSL